MVGHFIIWPGNVPLNTSTYIPALTNGLSSPALRITNPAAATTIALQFLVMCLMMMMMMMTTAKKVQSCHQQWQEVFKSPRTSRFMYVDILLHM